MKNQNTIRFGSAKIEVGETESTLIDLGIAEGISFTEEFEPIEVKPDNGPKLTLGTKNHIATVAFSMMELNLENLYLIRGGIDTKTNVAGSATPVTDEEHILSGVEFARLDHKNGDGSIVTSVTVVDASDNACVQDTDYILALDPEGYTCIARVAGSTVLTDGDTAKVDYTYTPNASIELSSGGLNTINPRVARLTNTNAAGKKFEVTVYKASNKNGIKLEFPADDAADVMKPEITLEGVVDTTRTAGDQLFKIVDEQGVLA
ncbi:predicted protein [Methanosarcina acetivorans C2A]|uniref:Uncharacterized protein n=1 Tax=Methanosarcina acetivorans (strain ATCC 35395 / DSM 2834 / JCM 12185 / C2A) TaxID=188937 RepID=Q8TJH6_METAC|nr:predicted protein [Methanosarcina acetivorans C2A]